MYREVIDQMDRRVQVPLVPRRIVSLVPSQTELLFDLGAGSQIAGVTNFCVHPHEKLPGITRIGGTKTVNLQKLFALRPDLVIANKEENDRSQIEEISGNCPVWISDISTLGQALGMIRMIGDLLGKESAALRLCSTIGESFISLPQLSLSVLYFIWRKPFMLAGQDTFIGDMLRRSGFNNLASVSRYPIITAEEIKQLAPDLIFLSSEPYPFAQKHIDELQLISPRSKVILVDGELFSWYGSRLRHTAAYLNNLTHRIGQNNF